MKKVIISIAALAVVIAAAVLILVNVNFFDKKPVLDASSSPEEIIAFYADAVKNSKEKSDFSLDVETTVELKAVNSRSQLLNAMLEGIMGYKVGDKENKTETITFSNGTASDNSLLTPFSVIQPSDAFVENVDYSSLSSTEVDNNDNSTTLSFMIKDETADLDSALAAINPILKGEVTNSSALMRLTPHHAKFIDVDDIFATVIDMLGVDSLINNNGSDNSSASSDGKKAVQILNGECSIGSSQMIADVNDNNCLNEVIIKVPVEFHAVIKFMNNNIDTVTVRGFTALYFWR